MRQAKRRQDADVRSVQRVGRIITALAERPYPMGVSEIAQRLSLAPSSTHRLLTTLVGMGWVEQNTRTQRYRLGTRLLGIGAAGLITNPIVQHGKTHVHRLSETTGCTTFLSTLVGTRVVYLARTEGVHGKHYDFEPGASMPAHALADGKLLLAYLEEEERQELYGSGPLRRYTENTITEPQELEAELAGIRAQGYAIDRGERFENSQGIAVPIMGPDGMPVLGMLLVAGPELDHEKERSLRSQMIAVAHDISEHLTSVGDMPMPSVPFARVNLE